MPMLTSIVGQKKFFVTKPFNPKVKAAADKAMEQIIANQYK
jgi:Ni,Fe-hydrogenase maturation factor